MRGQELRRQRATRESEQAAWVDRKRNLTHSQDVRRWKCASLQPHREAREPRVLSHPKQAYESGMVRMRIDRGACSLEQVAVSRPRKARRAGGPIRSCEEKVQRTRVRRMPEGNKAGYLTQAVVGVQGCQATGNRSK